MTKEEILEKHSNKRIFDYLHMKDETVECDKALKAMQEFADQEKKKEAIAAMNWILDTVLNSLKNGEEPITKGLDDETVYSKFKDK